MLFRLLTIVLLFQCPLLEAETYKIFEGGKRQELNFENNWVEYKKSQEKLKIEFRPCNYELLKIFKEKIKSVAKGGQKKRLTAFDAEIEGKERRYHFYNSKEGRYLRQISYEILVVKNTAQKLCEKK